jgi:hypothetical protein
MSRSESLPVNFTISAAAKRAIDQVRQDYDAQFSDPAAVLWVGWGFYQAGSEHQFENVVIGFYGQSELAEIAHGMQEASGVKLIFFVTEEFHSNFEGKILDFADDRRFFLRSPQSGVS